MPFVKLPIAIKRPWRAARTLVLRCSPLLFVFGQFAVSWFGLKPAHADQDMTFQLVSVGTADQCGAAGCPQVIAAEGQITDDTPQIFRAFVQDHYNRANVHAIILIDSYGGKVLASMALGRIFRQIGAAVVVAQPGAGMHAGGRCFSACVYALMGGRKRVVPPESQVGVHRMVAYGGGYDSAFSGDASTMRLDNGTVAAALSRYSASMGVHPGIISLAEHIPPGALHVLSRAEIARWNLAASRL